jgi:hypothetical protein
MVSPILVLVAAALLFNPLAIASGGKNEYATGYSPK